MTTIEKLTLASLNDAFRKDGPSPQIPGQRFATAGVSALPFEAQLLAWAAVAGFAAFTADNDPYGEHDFGSFVLPGAPRMFWKIDYYADAAMQWGAEDPAAGCFRVLTLMLASEY